MKEKVCADLDEDNTGTISVEKLQAGLEEKCSLARSEVVQITSALDANHDGQARPRPFCHGPSRRTPAVSPWL